jgi:hypothetical protein
LWAGEIRYNRAVANAQSQCTVDRWRDTWDHIESWVEELAAIEALLRET